MSCKYELKNGRILKDGHTMFFQDVFKDLTAFQNKLDITDDIKKLPSEVYNLLKKEDMLYEKNKSSLTDIRIQRVFQDGNTNGYIVIITKFDCYFDDLGFGDSKHKDIYWYNKEDISLALSHYKELSRKTTNPLDKKSKAV